MAVTSLLRSKYGKRGVGMFEVRDREASLGRLKSKRYEIYAGHLGAREIAEIEAAQRVRIRKLTILRDPVSRVLSAYRHSVKKGHKFPKLSSIGKNSSDELLSGLLNTQARQLAWSYTISATPPDLVWDEDALIKSATEALEGFDFVGFQEEFHVSITALSTVLGIPCPSEIPVVNSTKDIPVDFDGDDIAAAHALTRADQAIYDTFLSRR